MKLEFFPPGPRSWRPRWPIPTHRLVATGIGIVGNLCLFVGLVVASEGGRRSRGLLLATLGLALVVVALASVFRREKPKA